MWYRNHSARGAGQKEIGRNQQTRNKLKKHLFLPWNSRVKKKGGMRARNSSIPSYWVLQVPSPSLSLSLRPPSLDPATWWNSSAVKCLAFLGPQTSKSARTTAGIYLNLNAPHVSMALSLQKIYREWGRGSEGGGGGGGGRRCGPANGSLLVFASFWAKWTAALKSETYNSLLVQPFEFSYIFKFCGKTKLHAVFRGKRLNGVHFIYFIMVP